MNVNLEYIAEKALTSCVTTPTAFWQAQVRESANVSDPFDLIFRNQVDKGNW
jgi:hypothetical protein